MKTRPNIPLRVRFKILKRDGFRCQYCGVHAGNAELCVDHVIPKANGGEDEEWNFLTSCTDCNIGKSSEDDDVNILWAITCAKDRNDKDAAFMLFSVLLSRGWSPQRMLDTAIDIFGDSRETSAH